MLRRLVQFFFFLIIALLMAGGIAFFYRPFHTPLLELLLNTAGHEFFEGKARLTRGYIDSDLKLHAYGLKGNLKLKEGNLPFEISSFESVNSLGNFFMGKPILFEFKSMKPQASRYYGIDGLVTYQGFTDWSFQLDSQIKELDLEDIRWIEPQNLDGATGKMTGSLSFKTGASANTEFKLEANVQKPGGHLQARFFDLLTPYLPQLHSTLALKDLTRSKAVVTYDNASLSMNLVDSDKIKTLLHILVPDYNLNLNLNMEIRLDQKNAFFDIAQLLGLVEVSS